MNSIETVGLIGLGKMGSPMAGHLIAKGFRVIGCDPVAEACARARAFGVRIVDSPREVARAAGLVIIVVGFESEVEDVVFGKDGILAGAGERPVVALASTVAPHYAKRLAARLGER